MLFRVLHVLIENIMSYIRLSDYDSYSEVDFDFSICACDKCVEKLTIDVGTSTECSNNLICCVPSSFSLRTCITYIVNNFCCNFKY